eukprot:gene2671-5564_t
MAELFVAKQIEDVQDEADVVQLRSEVESLHSRLKKQREVYEKQFEELERLHAQEIEEIEYRHREELQKHIDTFKETVLFHEQHGNYDMEIFKSAHKPMLYRHSLEDSFTNLPVHNEDSKSTSNTQFLQIGADDVQANCDKFLVPSIAPVKVHPEISQLSALEQENRALRTQHEADMEHYGALLESAKHHQEGILLDETRRADNLQIEVDHLQQRVHVLTLAIEAKEDELISVRQVYDHESDIRQKSITQLENQIQDLMHQHTKKIDDQTGDLERAKEEVARLNARLHHTSGRLNQLQKAMQESSSAKTKDIGQSHDQSDAATNERRNHEIGLGNTSYLSTFSSDQVDAQLRSSENRVRALLNEREQMKETIKQLKDDVTQVRASKTTLAQELSQDAATVKEQLCSHIRDMEKALHEKSSELNDLKIHLATLEDGIDQHFHTLLSDEVVNNEATTHNAKNKFQFTNKQFNLVENTAQDHDRIRNGLEKLAHFSHETLTSASELSLSLHRTHTPQQQLTVLCQVLSRLKAERTNLKVQCKQLLQAQESIKEERDVLLQQASIYQTQYNDIASQENSVKTTVESLRRQVDTIQANKERLEEDYKKSVDQNQELHNRIHSLEQELVQANSSCQIRLAETHRAHQKTVKEQMEKIQAFQTELETALGAKVALEAHLGTLLQEISHLREENAQLQDRAKLLEETSARLQDRHDFSLERATRLELELAQTKTECEHLHKLANESKRREERIEENAKVLREAQSKLQVANSKLHEKEKKLQYRIESLHAQNQNLASAEAELQNAIILRDKAQTDLHKIKKKFDQCTAKCNAIEWETSNAAKANEAFITDLNNQLQLSKTRASRAESNSSEIHARVMDLETKLAQKVRSASTDKETIKSLETRLTESTSDLAKKDRQVQQLLRRIKDLEHSLFLFEASKEQFNRTRETQQAQLMEKLRHRFHSQMMSLSVLEKYNTTVNPLSVIQQHKTGTCIESGYEDEDDKSKTRLEAEQIVTSFRM